MISVSVLCSSPSGPDRPGGEESVFFYRRQKASRRRFRPFSELCESDVLMAMQYPQASYLRHEVRY